MESKLSITEFRTRLSTNTEIGSLQVKLSSFKIFPTFVGTKPFYGFFDNQSFYLTVNSATSPTFYTIIGEYKTVNDRLIVDYIVEPNSKFQFMWVRYAPVICLILINLFIIVFAKGLRRATTIINLFMLFLIFYSRWKEERRRKKMEQKFLRIFEIIR